MKTKCFRLDMKAHDEKIHKKLTRDSNRWWRLTKPRRTLDSHVRLGNNAPFTRRIKEYETLVSVDAIWTPLKDSEPPISTDLHGSKPSKCNHVDGNRIDRKPLRISRRRHRETR